MAFDLNEVYGYGTGKLQDITVLDGATDKINSYARVTDIGDNEIEINTDTQIIGSYEKFEVGADILLHVSASISRSEKLGMYKVARILAVEGGRLRLDKNLADILTAEDLDSYFVQAVTFANFDCLTLGEGGTVTAPSFSPYHFVGGILCIKCWDSLIFKGGDISLSNAGIPTTRRNTLRPVVEGEPFGKERLLLNAGDGAAFIVARRTEFNPESKIGDTENVNDSPHVTASGGSSIIFVSEQVANYTEKTFSIKRGAVDGKGLAQLYIANEEIGDWLSNAHRLRDYGVDGSGRGLYSLANPTYELNNFAVVEMFKNKCKYGKLTRRGLAALQVGALVYCGKFARVLKIGEAEIILDRQLSGTELVSVCEVEDLKLTQDYKPRMLAVVASKQVEIDAQIETSEIVIVAEKIVLGDSAKLKADKIFLAAAQLEGYSADKLDCKEKFIFK